MRATSEGGSVLFLAALNVKQACEIKYEALPNVKPSTEATFWRHYGTWETWMATHVLDTVKVEDGWAKPMLFFTNRGRLLSGGFLVMHTHSGWQPGRVEYFEWRACEHDFKTQNLSNCWNRYTCTKCGRSYEVDSSD